MATRGPAALTYVKAIPPIAPHICCMFVIDRDLPSGPLTVYAETAAQALVEARAFVDAGEVVAIAGPDGEELTIQQLVERAASEEAAG